MSACTPDTCGQLSNIFFSKLSMADNALYFVELGAMLVTPAIIGLFWGAPLIAREIEAHSLTLAWKQTVQVDGVISSRVPSERDRWDLPLPPQPIIAIRAVRKIRRGVRVWGT